MYKLFFFAALFFLSFLPAAHSAVILKVKGRKALVDLEGVQVEKGDRFDAIDLYGKSLGVLEIKKVKKGKAIAVLLKGKMGVSWVLEPSAKSAKAFNATEEYDPVDTKSVSTGYPLSPYSTGSSRSSSFFGGVGLILGPNYNTISVSPSSKVSGWSLQGNLTADFSIIKSLGIRILLGYQVLEAYGSNCGLSKCSLKIHYPHIGFLARGIFLSHSVFRPWVGGGGYLLWPLVDQRANLGLDKRSFASFHGSLTGAIGIDIYFAGFYLPIQLDASWINPVLISSQPLKPGSKEFKPLYLGLKFGIAFSL